MKALLFAAAALTVGITPAQASMNCTYSSSTGEVERCRGYDYDLGGYTATPTWGGGVRIQTDDGNTYTCNQFGSCRGGY